MKFILYLKMETGKYAGKTVYMDFAAETKADAINFAEKTRKLNTWDKEPCSFSSARLYQKCFGFAYCIWVWKK